MDKINNSQNRDENNQNFFVQHVDHSNLPNNFSILRLTRQILILNEKEDIKYCPIVLILVTF